MMNLEKKFIFTVFKISVKCKFDGQTLIKCDILAGRLPKYFFQEICSSGGNQTIHKVSAAFIVKNFHPRTYLRRVAKVCPKSLSIFSIFLFSIVKKDITQM